MPFTAAHPAIILPLLRRSRWLSTTGLIIGALAPDFEYFFRLETRSEISHSLRGIFLFNLPVTLLLATVFHLFVRDLVVKYLPEFLKKRAAGVRRLDWLVYMRRGGWLALSLSACIGAASHLFWDSFTHYNMYFVREWPILQRPVDIYFTTLPLCRLIQHLSTIFGSIAIISFVLRLKPTQPHQKVSAGKKFSLWFTIALVSLLFMAVTMALDITPRSLRGVTVSLLSGSMLTSIALGFLEKLKDNSQD